MSNPTILIVDYEPRSIERISEPLEAAGYNIAVARDGIAGLERFAELEPDLVILEAMLPKKHGFEVCREIKDSPAGPGTPVIIMTAVYRGRKYRYEAIHQHGCDRYLEKPVEPEEIVALVSTLLGVEQPAVSGDAPEAGTAAPESPPEPEPKVASVSAGTEPSPPAQPEDEISSAIDSLLGDVSQPGER